MSPFVVYLLIGLCSFFFVVVPVTGGVVMNPLLSLAYAPHVAISLSVFFFAVNSTIKAFVFRRDIDYPDVVRMIPLSAVAAVAGSLLIGVVPARLLLVVMLAMTVHFAVQKWRSMAGRASRGKGRRGAGFLATGVLSGFMQGAGLGGGGSIRKAYFLGNGFTLQQMHGTTSALSLVLGIVATLTRLLAGQATVATILPVLVLLPLMVVGTVLGKRVLGRLSARTSDGLVMATFAVTVVALLWQITTS